VPFTNGKPTLVNVGAYHCVRNDSIVDRIAVIVEGMPVLSTRQLLALAREQNPIGDKAVVHRALARRLDLVKAEGAIREHS
jgi:hypothetical protein